MIKTSEGLTIFVRSLCCNKCGKDIFINYNWKMFYPFASKIKDEELEDMLIICRDCLKHMKLGEDEK